MKPNAYILSWTMNDYKNLLAKLQTNGFQFEYEDEDVRVDVPFFRVDEFIKLVQEHLNAPFNYVDISYPEEKKLVIAFGAKKFVISTKEELEETKKWAINLGLPPEQADLKPDFI